ncbi:hypothetical protein HN953_02480, partial [Candidatus Woesearchaeota archaeon]|nr:hypothetical protein [Candidatus Woesearchaeota archaeon]
EKDFIEVEYTGTIVDDNVVFDTTDEKIAKDNEIFAENAKYGPIVVCLGMGHLLKGLDAYLIGKKEGKYSVDIKDVDAFGKKSAKLLKLIPMKFFIKEKIRPYPGLEVEIDGKRGLVRNVSGGRIIVDFNHPLSSKDLKYDVEVKRIVTDMDEKVKSIFKLELNFADIVTKYDEKAKVITITSVLPEQIHPQLEKRVLDLIPEIKSVKFIVKKQEQPKEKTEKAVSKKVENVESKKEAIPPVKEETDKKE